MYEGFKILESTELKKKRDWDGVREWGGGEKERDVTDRKWKNKSVENESTEIQITKIGIKRGNS